MASLYDLITIDKYDLETFERYGLESKIGFLINLVLDEIPEHMKGIARFCSPYLKPIEGFEDEFVLGYEVVVDESPVIEKFIKSYIPFFILKKEIKKE